MADSPFIVHLRMKTAELTREEIKDLIIQYKAVAYLFGELACEIKTAEVAYRNIFDEAITEPNMTISDYLAANLRRDGIDKILPVAFK